MNLADLANIEMRVGRRKNGFNVLSLMACTQCFDTLIKIQPTFIKDQGGYKDSLISLGNLKLRLR